MLARKGCVFYSTRWCCALPIATGLPFWSRSISTDNLDEKITNISQNNNSPTKKKALYRKDLAKILATEHKLSLNESNKYLTTLLDSIMESVVENKPVRISGFGSFEMRQSKARKGRLPWNGKLYKSPTRNQVKFSAYTLFKGLVTKK